MKEQIYTIPVNEVYDTDCSCPLCELENRIERESVEYALGAAMMEPDFRVESNERGYCRVLYAKLFEKPNKLSLALILDTHLMEIRKRLEAEESGIKALSRQKSGLFKKNGAKDAAQKLHSITDKINCDCMICKKVNFTMERYIDVIMYMYFTDTDFKEKFNKSNGFCFKHFNDVLKIMPSSLSDSQTKEFLPALFEKEKLLLDGLQEDIHNFTLKFDYRNKDIPWGNAKDAPIRVIQALSGTANDDKNE